ncbi:MAG: GNAT family N-acetyltransferase [Oscillibacter sp.]|nr:GNAT family N-acetyltransferase [Oscillibacter sp.]
MDQFKPVTKQDGAKLRHYYQNCNYGLCEYSVGTKLMWRPTLHPSWAEIAGCLVIRNCIDGQTVFDYPVPGPEGDEDAALEAIEAYCLEQGVPLVISVVPDCKAPHLLSRYPYVRVSNIRTWRDYVYYRQDLQLFAGRRYSGQRNHIKKFRTQWPDAVFRRLTTADAPAIDQFWLDYEAEFPKGSNAKARDELALAKKMLRMVDKRWFVAGGMFDGDKLIALSLAEKCGETLLIHIEKALYSYTGVYPTLVQAFADAFGEGCQWVNREDDAADRGLRTSKLQYGPAKLAPKYRFEPQNELLSHVREIPVLKTERLTLSALTEADLPAYNALVLDQERNRWWGYDDAAGLGGPVEERSFLDVAERDFANRQAVNFAVRLEGKLIGEAVLYRFDCRGGAELGCRIAAAYDGHGYGTEAFAAVADWALYKVHLTRVVAKCFKENAASYKMLSSCMRRHGEDETYFYFEKPV